MKNFSLKVTAAGIVVLLGVLVYGCGGGGGGGGSMSVGAMTQNIDVVNNAAAPMGFSFMSPVTIKSGTVVTWVNQTAATHGITWDSWIPNSSPGPGANIPVFTGGTDSNSWTAPTVTVNTTYNYHCTVHGPTMAGVIIVTP